MAEVDTGQLERVLGRPDWQAMSFEQVNARARSLETEAHFARTLIRYMDDGCFDTTGEALAALTATDRAQWRASISLATRGVDSGRQDMTAKEDTAIIAGQLADLTRTVEEMAKQLK